MGAGKYYYNVSILFEEDTGLSPYSRKFQEKQVDMAKKEYETLKELFEGMGVPFVKEIRLTKVEIY